MPDAENKTLQKYVEIGKDEGCTVETLMEAPTTNTSHVRDSNFGYLVVLASCVCHAIFFGINLSFGLVYVELLDYFDKPRGVTAWIGSVPKGMLSFMGTIAGLLTDRYGSRIVTIIGGVIACSGFVISSFATNIEYLYASYGVVVGIGLGLMILPSRVVVIQHNSHRRALCNSIASSGGGLGLAGFSYLIPVLYEQFNLRGMFLVMGGVALNAVVCGALYRPILNKVEKPQVQSRGEPDRSKICCPTLENSSLFGNRKFLVFVFSNFVSTLGIFVPYTHLPKRAYDLGIPTSETLYLMPALGVSSIIGRILFGWFADFKKVEIATLWSLSNIISGITLLIFPLLTSFPLLLCFSIGFGTFIGAWTGLKTMVIVEMVGLNKLSKALGMAMFVQGFASVAGSPLAGWLFDLTESYTASFLASGCMFQLAGFAIIFMQLNTCLHR